MAIYVGILRKCSLCAKWVTSNSHISEKPTELAETLAKYVINLRSEEHLYDFRLHICGYLTIRKLFYVYYP